MFPIITISGGSCSGKTTFVEGFRNAVIISLDSFYKDLPDLVPDQDGNYDFDTPDAIDLDACKLAAIALSEGKDVEIPTYDYISCRRTGVEKVRAPEQSGSIVVVEGIFALRPPLLDIGTIRMFIEAPVEIRLARRIRRDVARGRDVKDIIAQFVKVEEGHQKFIEPTKQFANLVIPFSHSPIVFSA